MKKYEVTVPLLGYARAIVSAENEHSARAFAPDIIASAVATQCETAEVLEHRVEAVSWILQIEEIKQTPQTAV